MRFALTGKTIHQIPPEMFPGLIDAAVAWANKYTTNKKVEHIWHFSGGMAGVIIVNVNSAEELNAMIAEFPFAPFAEMEVHALLDFRDAMQQIKQVVQAMAPGKR